MKISVVTISFNQKKYLSECIKSVSVQDGPWEHIIVDPGSTDGSRELIKQWNYHFSHIIFEPDKGPADGLNKGFSLVEGEILCYLNSDDTFEPGAFKKIRDFFKDINNQSYDVVSGHAKVIDSKGNIIREVFSDKLSKVNLALGVGLLIQPSTFIRNRAYYQTKGFNVENRSNWDGELVVDMFMNGAKFYVLNSFLSNYRIHSESITGAGMYQDRINLWAKRRYYKLFNKDIPFYAGLIRFYFRVLRILKHPKLLYYKFSGRKMFGGGGN